MSTRRTRCGIPAISIGGTRTALVAAMIVGVLARSDAAGHTPTSWFGTWRLNVAKSTYGSEPALYKRATRQIVPSEGGGITIIDDLMRIRGGIVHLEWTGKFDGLDYPVQGVEVVLTSAYRRLDDRTCELIQKIDGMVVATARLALSPDGKVLSTVTSARTESVTTIYERQ